MPTAIVLCLADPSGNPRPNRMIRWLMKRHVVHVATVSTFAWEGVVCDPLPAVKRGPWQRLRRCLLMLARQHDRLIWNDGFRALVERHRRLDHALIVTHDPRLWPIALAMRDTGRVIFDAREYYPRHFEDIWWWRMLHGPHNAELCRRYLPQADHVITVSPGLVDAYRSELDIHCELVPSLPDEHRLAPVPVDPERVRIVHHGLASRSRNLEVMIRMMKHVQPRFSLDMFLAGPDEAYKQELHRLARTIPNVRILPPVPFAELIPATAGYDIGLFLIPDISTNLRFALPNKFFEFVQARLMIAIGPSPDMAALTRQYDLGVVASDFRPETLAAALNQLSAADIMRYKANAHKAAARLHSGANEDLLSALVAGKSCRREGPIPS